MKILGKQKTQYASHVNEGTLKGDERGGRNRGSDGEITDIDINRYLIYGLQQYDKLRSNREGYDGRLRRDDEVGGGLLFWPSAGQLATVLGPAASVQPVGGRVAGSRRCEYGVGVSRVVLKQKGR